MGYLFQTFKMLTLNFANNNDVANTIGYILKNMDYYKFHHRVKIATEYPDFTTKIVLSQFSRFDYAPNTWSLMSAVTRTEEFKRQMNALFCPSDRIYWYIRKAYHYKSGVSYPNILQLVLVLKPYAFYADDTAEESVIEKMSVIDLEDEEDYSDMPPLESIANKKSYR